MALIAMAVWDTVENGRHVCTAQTIDSIRAQVDLARHRVFIVDNASTCPITQAILQDEQRRGGIEVIHLPQNIGTARAINRAWERRAKGECAVKMDNDVVVHQKDWPDLMEEVFRRDPTIGIVGWKRNDCWENPTHDNEWYRSVLYMLPHKPGERWIVAEQVHHVIGTCQAYSDALLEKMGYLVQFGNYGLDDSLAAVRCEVAGMKSVFIPSVPIDHVDNVESKYTEWKQKVSSTHIPKFLETIAAYRSGKLSIYHSIESGSL